MGEPYYKHHVFFCTNQRENRSCCQDHDALTSRAHAKDKVKAAGLAVPGGVRINGAGCLNRCGEGPVMVVYPEGVWYSYTSTKDIDEIIDRHLTRGQVVQRLRIA